jgi:hypothetical protein
VCTSKNTWSRAARRAKAQARSPLDSGDNDVVLECHLLCEDGEGDGMAISFQWLRGREPVLFEGFCNHVMRKIARRPSHNISSKQIRHVSA